MDLGKLRPAEPEQPNGQQSALEAAEIKATLG